MKLMGRLTGEIGSSLIIFPLLFLETLMALKQVNLPVVGPRKLNLK